MYQEVPAHVQHVDQTRNGVAVKGGTNWDLSRSAVATPIAPAKDADPRRAHCDCSAPVLPGTPYAPEHRMPAMDPVVTLHFSPGSSVMRVSDARALARLRKGATVVIAGHADGAERGPRALAEARAKRVAEHLRRAGKKVEAVRSFGAELPLAEDLLQAEHNRRVEVFVR